MVRRGTIKTLLIEQLPNLQYLVELVIQVMFVDRVLNVVERQRREEQHGGVSEDALHASSGMVGTALAEGSMVTTRSDEASWWGPQQLAIFLGMLTFAPVRRIPASRARGGNRLPLLPTSR